MVSSQKNILAQLSQHHDGKFGFVVYRCAYNDDGEWARFIERLYAHAHARLEEDEDGKSLKPHVTFDVMEDKADLDGATKEHVRSRFSQWRGAVGGDIDLTRYVNCIYADREVIEAVLNGDEPGEEDVDIWRNPTGFVKVLDHHFEESPEPLGPEDEPNETVREAYNRGDEGYPPVEGCRRENVGWTKIAARALVPRTYGMLMGNGWHIVYVRPPQIMNG